MFICDISGIPPKTLLKYFPRLEEIAAKTLFGTDWPGPGVPDIKRNVEEFRALPLSQAAQSRFSARPRSRCGLLDSRSVRRVGQFDVFEV